MFHLLSKLIAIVISVLTLSFPSPRPVASPIVLAPTETLVPFVPSAGEAPSVPQVEASTPIPTPDIAELVRQLKEVQQEIASYTPEPTPINQLTPTPMPKALPTADPTPPPTVLTTKEFLTEDDYFTITGDPSKITSIKVEIYDADEELMDLKTSQWWLNIHGAELDNGQAKSSVVVLSHYEIKKNPQAITLTLPPKDGYRFSDSHGGYDGSPLIKIVGVTGGDLIVQ